MRIAAASAGLFVLISSVARGQASGSPQSAFEVASVRPSAQGSAAERIWGETGKVSLHHIPLTYVLMHVYNLQLDQVSGPAWMSEETYDILATVPTGAPKGQIPPMFEALLKERFKMRFHREAPMTPVYALVVGKGGPKLKEALPGGVEGRDSLKTAGTGENEVTTMTGAGYTTTIANHRLVYQYRSMSMKSLAAFLNTFRLDLPIVDLTEMQGDFQITLDISERDLPRLPKFALPPDPDADPPGTSIFDSVHKLGLDLVRREAPREKLVVDHIEKTPTPN